MRFTHHFLTAGCLCATFAASAQTNTPDSSRMERLAQMRGELQKRFTAADANGDGKLTRDEAKGRMPMVEKNFDAIDTARTGAITLGDIESYAITQKGKHKTVH